MRCSHSWILPGSRRLRTSPRSSEVLGRTSVDARLRSKTRALLQITIAGFRPPPPRSASPLRCGTGTPSSVSRRCRNSSTTHHQTPANDYRLPRTCAAEYRWPEPGFTVHGRTSVNVDKPPQTGRSCLRSRRPQVRILPGALVPPQVRCIFGEVQQIVCHLCAICWRRCDTDRRGVHAGPRRNRSP